MHRLSGILQAIQNPHECRRDHRHPTTAEHRKISQTQQTATALLQHPEGNEGPKLQINDTNAHEGDCQGNNSVETTRDRRLAVNQLRSRGNEDEPMIRRISSMLILSITIAGCNIDGNSIKDCQDKDGKPLPEWVCRKDDAPEKNEE